MMSMKFVTVCVAIALVAVCLAQQDDEADWKAYKKTQKKSYADAKEEAKRKALFAAVNKRIKQNNANPKASFTLQHNELSDATDDEKKILLGATAASELKPRAVADSGAAVPSSRQSLSSFDLRTNRCLSAIRNQGQCGSCWSFSALASVEYALCKKTGILYNLSEQHLVDCDIYDSGCNGGWMSNAMYYLKNTARFSANETAYPYTSGTTKVTGTCKASNVTAAARVNMTTLSYYQVTSLDHVAMANALISYGPLSVALNVVNDGFYSYKDGVYTSTMCGNSTVNHATNIVGFGRNATLTNPITSTTGIDFWIMRNSWGTGWGSKGYMNIARGVNMCNIERYAYAVKSV